MRISLYATVFILCLYAVSAVNYTLNSTYDIKNVGRPSSIFVDGDGYIYIIGDSDNRVYKFYVDDDSLQLERKFGSDDSSAEDYMKSSRDIWVDEEYVYVMDRSNEFFKFDKEGNLKAHPVSESYKPETGIAIAANDGYVYLVDRDNNRVNIAHEYSENNYILNGTISYTFLGIGDAIFNMPYDIFVQDDMIYIVDSGKNRIAVFTTSLDYIMSYGRGRGDTRFSSPYFIAMDDEYLYVVQSGMKSIMVVRKDTGVTVLEINDSYYPFKRIKGLFARDDLLYVVDNLNDTLIVFNIDRTSRLTYDEVEPLFNSFNSSVADLCELYSVSDSLNLSIINKCGEYENDVHNANSLITNDSYDAAYDVMQSAIPSVEGDLAYLRPLIRDEINKYYNEVFHKAVSLQSNYTGALNISYTKIMDDLDSVNDTISHGEYSGVVSSLKEISIKIDLFEQSLSSEEENANQLKEDYTEELESLKERYYSIRDDLIFYPTNTNLSKIDALIQDIEQSIENKDFADAYDKLAILSTEIYSAETNLANTVKEVNDANKTITEARMLLYNLTNKSLIFISPNTSLSEGLIANASAELMTNPSHAKHTAEKAIDEIHAADKDYEDFKFLLLVGFAAGLFIFLFGGLVAIGVILLLRRMKKR